MSSHFRFTSSCSHFKPTTVSQVVSDAAVHLRVTHACQLALAQSDFSEHGDLNSGTRTVCNDMNQITHPPTVPSTLDALLIEISH